MGTPNDLRKIGIDFILLQNEPFAFRPVVFSANRLANSNIVNIDWNVAFWSAVSPVFLP